MAMIGIDLDRGIGEVSPHIYPLVTADLALSVPPAGSCTAREMNAEHWFARNEPHQPRVVVTEQALDSWPTRYTFAAHSLTVISG
ncbi:MAG TPA: hypothetical protein VM221_06985 [Armatimonadota bacterium]|nr:hypothetical protein [Armatimonadota bacterium]